VAASPLVYARLGIEVEDGLWATFAFEGDLFEMEDQRNWTHASFKTYSTPITLGWPRAAAAGQPLVQAVKLSGPDEKPQRPRRSVEEVQIELGEPRRQLLSPFGLWLSSSAAEPSERELKLLEALRADHLRVDLHFSGGWRDELDRAARTALSLATGLELALFLGEDPDAELDELAKALPLAQARVNRLLLLQGEDATGSALAQLARERLATVAPGAPISCGTDGCFAEFNRARPDVAAADAVFYSICATVHADDDACVSETPAAQGDTVRSARAVFEKPVVVSPVTFRPRTWPFGRLDESLGLPYQVDPRQCSLFGAGWTVASAKHLLEAGASSITFFETVGPRGVVESEAGSSFAAFPSRPGQAFPLYHVLADLGDWRQTVLVPSSSPDPLTVDALAVRSEAGVHALVANLSREMQRCRIGPLSSEEARLRVLDEDSVEVAGRDPEAFRQGPESRSRSPGGALELELRPYSVVRVDP
jgi:D-apionolactonase